MIVEHRKYLTWTWFSPEIRFSVRTVYLQSPVQTFCPGMVRIPFLTRVIDLNQTPDQLLAAYSPKTRYEIRRAEREGLHRLVNRDAEPLIRLFRPTATAKGLKGLKEKDVVTKPDYLVTRIMKEEEVLAAHFYLPDPEERRILLLFAASAFRQSDIPSRRYLAGMAHRLLYHQDFLDLREKGFFTFDFGGYGGLAGADRFKESFGGQTTVHFNYYPWWYDGWRKGRNLLKNSCRSSNFTSRT